MRTLQVPCALANASPCRWRAQARPVAGAAPRLRGGASVALAGAAALLSGSSSTTARRPQRLRVLRVRAAAHDGELTGPRPDQINPDDPHQILRISPGTTFLGLLSARREAREKAKGNEEQLAKVEAAFRTFVDKAEERFKQTVADAPGDPCALYSYGNFLQTIEDWDGAEEQYKKVLETEGHELHDRVIVDAINNYATMLHEQRQDFEGANALYEQAAAKKPDDVDLLFNWADLRRNGLNDLEGAIELVDKIVALRADLAEHPLVQEFREAQAAAAN